MIKAVKQFTALAEYWGIPNLGNVDLEQVRPEIEHWYQKLIAQMNLSRLGYPLHAEVFSEPVIETEFCAITGRLGLEANFTDQKPTVCLSHDVDYFKPTPQLVFKEVLGRRTWRKYFSAQKFLDSYAALLELDDRFLKTSGPTTFFASPIRSRNPGRRLKQWLIDPSYSWSSPEAAGFIRLVKHHKVDVGIHGSIFSLSEDTFEKEVQNLSSVFDTPVKVARQHWLHLPDGIASMAKMNAFGIRTDSTLGWNGHSAFRGGIARPYPIVLNEQGDFILEVPLLIMDGVFFDELKLTEAEAFQRIIALLAKVKSVNGTVALNWHDRAAHIGYGWIRTYQRVLEWCASEGFQFTNISEATGLYGTRN